MIISVVAVSLNLAIFFLSLKSPFLNSMSEKKPSAVEVFRTGKNLSRTGDCETLLHCRLHYVDNQVTISISTASKT
jgi:hypothetical protein